MTFFVDANVIVYSATESAYREPCLEVLEAVAQGAVDGRTSTSALEEVWHLEHSGRAGALEGLTKRAYALLAPLLAVTDEAFRQALSIDAASLGPNDRLHAGTCIAHGVEVIVSADGGFDELRDLRRIDPLDESARRRLLGDRRT